MVGRMVSQSVPNGLSATNRQVWLYNISRGKSVDRCNANEHTIPYLPLKQQTARAGQIVKGKPIKNKNTAARLYSLYFLPAGGPPLRRW